MTVKMRITTVPTEDDADRPPARSLSAPRDRLPVPQAAGPGGLSARRCEQAQARVHTRAQARPQPQAQSHPGPGPWCAQRGLSGPPSWAALATSIFTAGAPFAKLPTGVARRPAAPAAGRPAKTQQPERLWGLQTRLQSTDCSGAALSRTPSRNQLPALGRSRAA